MNRLCRWRTVSPMMQLVSAATDWESFIWKSNWSIRNTFLAIFLRCEEPFLSKNFEKIKFNQTRVISSRDRSVQINHISCTPTRNHASFCSKDTTEGEENSYHFSMEWADEWNNSETKRLEEGEKSYLHVRIFAFRPVVCLLPCSILFFSSDLNHVRFAMLVPFLMISADSKWKLEYSS